MVQPTGSPREPQVSNMSQAQASAVSLIDKEWPPIRDVVDQILSGQIQTLSIQGYMQLYTKLCYLSTTLERYTNMQVLYSRLDAFLEETCRGIGTAMEQEIRASGKTLDVYVQHWKQFENAGQQVENVFSHINRHWVKLRQSEGAEILGIYSLHLKRWRECSLAPMESEITEALLKNMKKWQKGETIDNTLMRDVLSSLDTLSPSAYWQVFEEPLLSSLVPYHKELSTKHQKQLEADAIDDGDWVDSLLKDEKERYEAFVPQNSMDRIMEACREILLNTEILESG